MSDEEYQEECYEKLKNSKFKQQRMIGWRPIPSVIGSSIIFLGISIIFIGLGVLILIFSKKIKEKIVRFDDQCHNTRDCNISIDIEEDMEKMIMIYYQLNGFYQNYRRYDQSRSKAQLKGEEISLEKMKDSKDCEPFVTNRDMGKNMSYDYSTPLNGDDLAIPCGLVAKSYYELNLTNWKINDVISFKPNETGISWKSDREYMYKNSKDMSRQWIDMTNEHFIVWMRTEAFSDFRKLWGRIDYRNLKKGDRITVTVNDNYINTKFNGEKYLILSTVNEIGGKNTFLAYSYISVGILCFILGVLLIIGNILIFSKEKKM